MKTSNQSHQATTEQKYRLGGRCVCPKRESGRGYWGQTVFFDRPSPDGVEAMDFAGHASLEDAVLWLSSTKVYSNPSFDSPAEYETFLASLPPYRVTTAIGDVERFFVREVGMRGADPNGPAL